MTRTLRKRLLQVRHRRGSVALRLLSLCRVHGGVLRYAWLDTVSSNITHTRPAACRNV